MANISTNGILSYGKISDGTKEYIFQTSSIYKTAAIAVATGIVSIANDAYDGVDPLVKLEQLLRSGKLVRLSALVANPIDGKKNKTAQILCRADLAITARSALVGKVLQTTRNGQTYAIGKIIKIRGRTRDRYS